MDIIRRLLPHFSLAFSVSLIVAAILNNRNPAMGFLLSRAGTVLTITACILGVICAVILIVQSRRSFRRRNNHLNRQ